MNNNLKIVKSLLVGILVVFVISSCAPSYKSVMSPNTMSKEYTKGIPSLIAVVDRGTYDTAFENAFKKRDENQHRLVFNDFNGYCNNAQTFITDDLKENVFNTNVLDSNSGYIVCRLKSARYRVTGMGFHVPLAIVTCMWSWLCGAPMCGESMKQTFEFTIYDCYDREVKKYEIEAKGKSYISIYKMSNTTSILMQDAFKNAMKKFNELILSDKNYITEKLNISKQYMLEEQRVAMSVMSDENELYDRALNNACLGNYEMAQGILDTLLRNVPYHASAYGLRGMCRQEMKNYIGALKDYTRCAQLSSPESGLNTYVDKARMLGLFNRIPESYIAAGMAVKLQPMSEDAHNAMAVVLENMGRYSEAIVEYNKILTINPNRIELHQRVADLKSILKNAAEAKARYEQEQLMRQAAAMQMMANTMSNTVNSISNIVATNRSTQVYSNTIQSGATSSSNRASLENQLRKAKLRLVEMYKNQHNSSSPVVQQSYNIQIVKQEELIRQLEQKLANCQ